MENVILTIHLILALLLIGIVLLQRSEGGGLGMGGGGAVSSRAAATALGKITWGLAIGFIITSITLTILAAQDAGTSSVIDQLGGTAPTPAPTVPTLDGDLLPPSSADAPAAPPPATAPAAPPASN
jgi:preprotein translocase subunit SecG